MASQFAGAAPRHDLEEPLGGPFREGTLITEIRTVELPNGTRCFPEAAAVLTAPRCSHRETKDVRRRRGGYATGDPQQDFIIRKQCVACGRTLVAGHWVSY